MVTSVSAAHAAPLIVNSPKAEMGGSFGHYVSSDDGRVVVGALGERVNGFAFAGRVYVFRSAEGSLIDTFVSPNPEMEGFFGVSVSLAGTVLVVGADGETMNGHTGAGRVYVFNTVTGSLTTTLVSPNPETHGFFGVSVSLAGRVLVIGADGETGEAGRAYVFDIVTSSLTSTLVSPNPETEGLFGNSVSSADGRLVVGAPTETVNGLADAGRAYVFNAASGELTGTLVSPHSETNELFGSPLSSADGRVAVAAPGATVSGLSGAGRVYVFNTNTGSLTGTFVSPNPEMIAEFGHGVSLADGRLVVGAIETANGLASAGRAYVFSVATGSIISSLVSPNSETAGVFGWSVALADGRVVVCAPNETVNGLADAGRVYVFSVAVGP